LIRKEGVCSHYFKNKRAPANAGERGAAALAGHGTPDILKGRGRAR